MTGEVEVVRPGPLATVQDLGRPGHAHLGVPHSGAADPGSLRLANRLVGNSEDVAGLELTFGGAALRFHAAAWIAVTGAPLHVRPGGMNAPCHVPAGGVVEFGTPSRGVRTYVAVRGGLDVPPVLGSRSTDLLSGLGPTPLAADERLAVGRTSGPINVDVAPGYEPEEEPVLRIIPGPRDDWFEDLEPLVRGAYEVSSHSNRIGVRLEGPPLTRRREGELPSEGMVTGALQVPPNGLPIVFLTDHPTTGGYPVAAVLTTADLGRAGQLRPGQRVRFRLVAPSLSEASQGRRIADVLRRSVAERPVDRCVLGHGDGRTLTRTRTRSSRMRGSPTWRTPIRSGSGPRTRSARPFPATNRPPSTTSEPLPRSSGRANPWRAV